MATADIPMGSSPERARWCKCLLMLANDIASSNPDPDEQIKVSVCAEQTRYRV